MRFCSNPNCKQINPQSLTNFYKDNNKRDGIKLICKYCNNLLNIKSRYNQKQNNPEEFRKKEKNNELKYLFGLTLDKFNELLTNQNYSCGICQFKFNLKMCNMTDRACVDHDHKLKKGVPGFVRGLLCHHCNAALGKFKDNIGLLQKSIEYLDSDYTELNIKLRSFENPKLFYLTKEYRKNSRLKMKYKINLNSFDWLLEIQNNKCKICNEAINKLTSKVDHIHGTKIVRGLLCDPCNLGLGNFKDNPEFLRKAIEYLQQFN